MFNKEKNDKLKESALYERVTTIKETGIIRT